MICGQPLATRVHCRRHADANTARLRPARQEAQRTYATNRLGAAIRSGLIQRPILCSRCHAADTKINGHHQDYARPLDVIWLCYSCHRKGHIEEESR